MSDFFSHVKHQNIYYLIQLTRVRNLRITELSGFQLRIQLLAEDVSSEGLTEAGESASKMAHSHNG